LFRSPATACRPSSSPSRPVWSPPDPADRPARKGPVIPRYDVGVPRSASAARRTRPRGDDRSPARPRGWSLTSSPPREGTLMTAPQAAPPTTPGGSAPALVARRVTRRYGTGAGTVTALDAVDLEIGRGAFTAIM